MNIQRNQRWLKSYDFAFWFPCKKENSYWYKKIKESMTNVQRNQRW